MLLRTNNLMIKKLKVSPLAPKIFPKLPNIEGLKISTTAIDPKISKRHNLLLILSEEKSIFAGVFTKSSTASYSIVWSKKCLYKNLPRAIIVNSGNANAFTGKNGRETILQYTKTLSNLLKIKQSQILVASTGVIGEFLDSKKISSKCPILVKNLGKSTWENAAEAIKTTDTFSKGASEIIYVSGEKIIINGIAKGSGMIAPNMATMLSFVCTNANLSANFIKNALKEVNKKTFNMITVDNDMSTNDCNYLITTNLAKNKKITSLNSESGKMFINALEKVMAELAKLIVKDGEGASKFISINVLHAYKSSDAKNVAKTIANSPLVKTAIAGEDANWGRIVMAIGKSNAKVIQSKISISIGGIIVAKDGKKVENYNEKIITRHLKEKHINLDISLGYNKNHNATVWTCDFTKNYISINADYRS